MTRVLLLNADGSPVSTLGWQRAMSLWIQRKVILVDVVPGQVVRSPGRDWPMPSVVALTRWVDAKVVPAPTRRNVLARDGHACVYCGVDAYTLGRRGERLTLDHVVPRSRAVHGFVALEGGCRVPVNGWRNLVAACPGCNHAKAARTPAEAGLTLPRAPRRPLSRELVAVGGAVPETWRPFLEVA